MGSCTYNWWIFDQPLQVGVFPPGLETLAFGLQCNQELKVEVLPRSLTSLTFERDFNQPLGLRVLPLGLKRLKFWCTFQPGATDWGVPAGSQKDRI
jgi:hypothetical protein